MKIYRWNGEYWYHDKRNFLKRWRQWLVWIGGWEKANGAGWDIFRRFKGKRELRGLTPVSLFDHRVTFYGWGFQIRLSRGWFVWAKSHSDGLRCYISRDGTPNGAFVWYIGTPNHIVKSAAAAAEHNRLRIWLPSRITDARSDK